MRTPGTNNKQQRRYGADTASVHRKSRWTKAAHSSMYCVCHTEAACQLGGTRPSRVHGEPAGRTNAVCSSDTCRQNRDGGSTAVATSRKLAKVALLYWSRLQLPGAHCSSLATFVFMRSPWFVLQKPSALLGDNDPTQSYWYSARPLAGKFLWIFDGIFKRDVSSFRPNPHNREAHNVKRIWAPTNGPEFISHPFRIQRRLQGQESWPWGIYGQTYLSECAYVKGILCDVSKYYLDVLDRIFDFVC